MKTEATLHSEDEERARPQHFGILWLDEEEQIISQKFYPVKYRERALIFYSDVSNDRSAETAKLFILSANFGTPSAISIKSKDIVIEPLKFEPREFGLQDKTDFLRDRAHLMNFEMEVKPLDEFDFKCQYRLYWVEKNDEFYDFDPNEQIKVFRETLSMKESGEE